MMDLTIPNCLTKGYFGLILVNPAAYMVDQLGSVFHGCNLGMA